ncbi:MAG TPA: hypothetical protein VE093_05505 [Polyangiaceae bacterium]|nr:hypothetical protein [Polyangiaceae bacterium]
MDTREKLVAKTLYFSFSLSKHIGFPEPAVMIWVDKNNDGKGSPNESVLLTQDGLSWKGTKQVDVESTADLWFLVAYRATVEAKWTLQVAVGKEDGPVVCKGEAVVDEARDSFWAVCISEKEAKK